MSTRKVSPLVLVLVGIMVGVLLPERALGQDEEPDYPVDSSLVQALTWRHIGPYRGGRVTAVAGVPQAPRTFYLGATGGGVWKTTDGGLSWTNLSDGHFNTVTIGAIAVAPSDPNVVYVGTGESPVRGVTTSHGDGVYKSTDGGATWTHLGLAQTRQISTVRVHPQNPDLVYVAAQGMPWAPTPERGIYRSTDGGSTWELVLHVSDQAGASDLSMDVTNPRILYAAFWEHRRFPWQVVSGGAGSGLYKSTDGGTTWTELTDGLPDLMGKVGVAVSPVRPERVWALIEAEDGGLFRSDDRGSTWTRINEDRVLRARAWYYTHLFADTEDEETVYVLNAPMLKSVDGGATFTPIPTPHGDNHDLWIHPDDNQIMINSNDGGANVSTNGGVTWSTQANQPTAQFYRVITDNQFPYRVYGGQQDNSTVSIASRTTGAGIGRSDWHAVGGCESAHVAFDPKDPRYVYAGCYQGIITEYDEAIDQARIVMADPYLGLGADAKDLPYRFNWNAPIVVSAHDSAVIYHAGNVVLKSTDRGRSWEAISPDLTRDEPEKQGNGGAPITNEAAGAETYNTIMYLAESPHVAGTLWVGTDDGLVHLTQDGGATWTDVTPEGIGEAQINSIDVSPHDPAKAYLAVTRYKLGDYTPHIFRTRDYGQTWTRLVEGIEAEHFVRVVREDPARPGLLYAGTEAGLYLSADDGSRWQPFQRNLPTVPITDLRVAHGDLVAATQGRGFWVLDDLSPLHQLTAAVSGAAVHLFAPRPAYRVDADDEPAAHTGQNPPVGALLYYYVGPQVVEDSLELSIEIREAGGGPVLRRLTSQPDDEKQPKLPVEEGLNRFAWDLQREPVTAVDGLFIYGSLDGYRLAPGLYEVRLSAGEAVETRELAIQADPRLRVAGSDYREQARLLEQIWQSIDAIHSSVADGRSVQTQITHWIDATAEHAEADTVQKAGEALIEAIDAWEAQVVQPKQKTFQDVINFPNQLNAQLIYLMNVVDTVDPDVTEGAPRRFADLEGQWLERKQELRRLMLEDEVPAFNTLVRDLALPAVLTAPDEAAGTSDAGR